MLIADLDIRYLVHEPIPDTVFYTSPKIKISFNVNSDLAVRTRVLVTLTYASPKGAVSDNFESKWNYTSDVSFTVDVPSDAFLSWSRDITVDVQIYVETSAVTVPKNVAYLTECVDYPKYSPATLVSKHDFLGGYLKAFCSFPNPNNSEIYCAWEKSTDGIVFTPVVLKDATDVEYVKSTTLYTETVSELLDEHEDSVYVAKPCYPFKATDAKQPLSERRDILDLPEDFEGAVYSFRIFTLKDLDTSEKLKDTNGESVECTRREDFTLDYAVFTFSPSKTTELLYHDLPNAVSGKLFYSGNTTFAYGAQGFRNNILASNVGELVTPYSRVIDLPAQNYSNVTALTSWRNYIVASTASEMFLITKAEVGFFTKAVSTYIGVPAEDGRCFKATANGIIFKAHSKVYMFYPNMYSSDETILNLTELSKGVEHLLVDYPENSMYTPFGISTDSAYYILMPHDERDPRTTCLKYTYSTRVWTFFEYPVLFTDYIIRSVNDIVLYGTYNGAAVEYIFENETSTQETYTSTQLYGDFVLPDEEPLPISFELDSGQKTDSLNHNKQFVESKFNVVTLHEKDSFPMKVTVHVDGCPFVTTQDVNTDSAFWKQDVSQIGTLSTNFTSNDSDIFNVFRQMFIRYSGKGKSIRHIIEGESLYPFKIYEIDYRYRNLNVKQ